MSIGYLYRHIRQRRGRLLLRHGSSGGYSALFKRRWQQVGMHIQDAARPGIVLVEQDAEDLFAGGKSFGGIGALRRGQGAEQIVTFGRAEEHMHLLKHLSKFGVNLLMPALRLYDGQSFSDEARADLYH